VRGTRIRGRRADGPAAVVAALVGADDIGVVEPPADLALAEEHLAQLGVACPSKSQLEYFFGSRCIFVVY